MAHKGSIYLAGRWLQGVPGGTLEVPAETLVALFTLQYCQDHCIRVVLVTSRANAKTCKFPVSVASLSFDVEVKDEEECPEVLSHCELPAMIPQEEEEVEEEKKEEKEKKGKNQDETANRNQDRIREGELGEQLEEKEEDKKKQNKVKERKQEVTDNYKGAVAKHLEKEKEEEEEEEGKEQDEIQEGNGKQDEGEEERQNDRKKRNQESSAEDQKEKEEMETNVEEEKEKYQENQEKENKMEDGDDSGCKNGDDGDRWSAGPWCCAGLCSSLRLAVKQATQSRTRETNRSNRRNTKSNTNQDAGKRSNTRSNTSENARNTESNTNINTPSISNTTDSKSNTASNTVGTDSKINTSNRAGNTTHHAAALLGFRGGCLQACAEVSVWTKFCEVEAPAALLSLALAPYRGGEEVEYPRELLRYECHLRRPPILHNALKRTQRHIRETVTDGAERDELIRRPLAQLPPLSHQFAEGPDMTLADLMLFSCFHLLLACLTSSAVEPSAITPLVSTWHGTMTSNGHVQMALPVLEGAKTLFCGTPRPAVPPRVVVPSIPDVSIYKSDPERSRTTRGAFTRQGDVEEVLRVVEGAGVEPEYAPWPPRTTSPSSSTSSLSFFTSSSFSSSSSTSELPPLHTLLPALSLEGHIPESRLQRKVQQVENMCSAVLALARPGDVVVDFCSGGGHVGIPLAQCLPACRVLLVENKVPSLERARERVRHLRLRNVWFMQTNLDYFRGGFNVGVSLHACGVATDLVLGKCVAQGAAFVVAPCCYGSIRPNHIVSYPCSQAFHSLPLTLDQYLTLGHAADQTHGRDNPKTEQGQRCMRLVDGDRLAAVREVGYMTGLALMHPPTCSPKNHLLLGKPTA